MQSECLAVSPNLICSYVWKVPAARPATFDRNKTLTSSAGEKAGKEALRADHSSIPWKAYLASREFQYLASDVAEAFFAKLAPAGELEAPPSSLKSDKAALSAGGFHRGLLAPVLPDAVAKVPRAIAA
jgi:hypothetical protein